MLPHRSRLSTAAPDVSITWIPYANGRSQHRPHSTRPFAGILPLSLIPGLLLSALVLTIVAGADLVSAPSAATTDPSLSVVTVSENVISSVLPPQFTPTVQHWGNDIERWAASYDLPANWIAVVMQVESCGHPSIHSRAGAAGLFQVMPFHFGAGEDPLDVETNAARGLAYLARAASLASGDFRLALAGYNGGHGMISRPPVEWPPETQRYVRWGTGILADVDAGTVPSPTLAAWLDAGGRRLCRQAAGALGLAAESPSA